MSKHVVVFFENQPLVTEHGLINRRIALDFTPSRSPAQLGDLHGATGELSHQLSLKMGVPSVPVTVERISDSSVRILGVHPGNPSERIPLYHLQGADEIKEGMSFLLTSATDPQQRTFVLTVESLSN